MKKTFRTALSAAFLLLAALLIAGTASAGTPGGATVQNGTTSTWSNGTVGSNTSKGGYLTELNVSTTTQTSNWQGYFGNVTNNQIVLRDSGGSTMYTWTGSAANGGWVYATNKTSAPTWATITAVPATTLDTIWGLTGKSDSIALTYTGSQPVTMAGVSVGATANASVGSFFDSAVSETGSPTLRNQIIWAGKIKASTTNFKNGLSDYELLVPVTAGSEIYYFYLEIA